MRAADVKTQWRTSAAENTPSTVCSSRPSPNTTGRRTAPTGKWRPDRGVERTLRQVKSKQHIRLFELESFPSGRRKNVWKWKLLPHSWSSSRRPRTVYRSLPNRLLKIKSTWDKAVLSFQRRWFQHIHILQEAVDKNMCRKVHGNFILSIGTVFLFCFFIFVVCRRSPYNPTAFFYLSVLLCVHHTGVLLLC